MLYPAFLYIRIFRANREKLRTRLVPDPRLRFLTIEFILRHKLLVILLEWNIKKNLGLKVKLWKLVFHEIWSQK